MTGQCQWGSIKWWRVCRLFVTAPPSQTATQTKHTAVFVACVARIPLNQNANLKKKMPIRGQSVRPSVRPSVHDGAVHDASVGELVVDHPAEDGVLAAVEGVDAQVALVVTLEVERQHTRAVVGPVHRRHRRRNVRERPPRARPEHCGLFVGASYVG